jgi:hypothetical protein
MKVNYLLLITFSTGCQDIIEPILSVFRNKFMNKKNNYSTKIQIDIENNNCHKTKRFINSCYDNILLAVRDFRMEGWLPFLV